MYVFSYRKIGSEFIHELTNLILRGESIVLLGARQGGKGYAFSRLREQLESEGVGPIVNIRFLADTPVMTETAVSDLILQAIPPQEEAPSTNRESTDFFAPLDQLYAQNSQPAVLIAGNVDRLPHHLARRFLEEIRMRVEDGRLVVVLSGEGDLRDLVYGPNSEFNRVTIETR